MNNAFCGTVYWKVLICVPLKNLMQLNYKSFGSGPALIILHGLFGSLDNWQTLAKRFAEHFSVFIVDQRNHGKSPHVDDFSYEAMSEDLEDFMDQLGIYSAHVIGHSMGGKTAMTFALEYPSRVEKMVIVDMAPVAYEPHHEVILKALIEFPVNEVQNREEADSILRRDIHEAGVRNFLLKNLARVKGGGFQWKFNLQVIYDAYDSILHGIEADYPGEMPTLFLHGGNSEYVLPAHHSRIQALFPQSEFITIPNAGHWVHAEAPNDFFEKTLEFLIK